MNTDLADACHPGNEQLAEELVLYGNLGEKVVDLIVLTVPSVCVFSDHVSKNKTGFCKREQRNPPEGSATG